MNLTSPEVISSTLFLIFSARRHVNCYLKQQSGLKTFKSRICALERLEQLYEIVEELKQTVSEE